MAKYSRYIELRPGYESVVDIGSEERNPNLWQEYIVHDDMKISVEKICDSLKMEDPNQRRSFWIHGTYGTGKSYAAIVLKHLFTDSINNIENFFDRKRLLTPYKNKFLSIRNRGEGEFLVVWKSGCTGIATGTQLMMEMEMSIRKALKERFGENACYGRNSLVDEAKRIVSDKAYNWNAIFGEPSYRLEDDYEDFDSFKDDVLGGDIKACNTVAKICRDKGWAMFASVENFEHWITDAIVENHLQDKGIVFLWDEFTDFVRSSGDDNVLQRLSEYCKKQPFFMFLIVHVDTSWLSALGEDTYNRIMHRYHELEFHISESAAYEMIGESIECKKGMEDNWNAVRNSLVKEIISEFDEVSYGLKKDQLIQLCPIHPMTLSLLTKVSGNFAAASRTLFSFMKDQAKSEQNVGFLYYIETNGPEDWRWLTIDYLWDYFFGADSDIRSFSQDARRAYQLYGQKKTLVESDEYALRVFKAALLLIAIMATDKVTYTKGGSSKVDATRSTLRKCFVGQLVESRVDDYLQSFHDSNILMLAQISGSRDARVELPYGRNVEKFDVRLEEIQKRYTRYELFKKNGEFARTVEDKIWSKTDATFGRMYIAACTEETNSLNQRFNELQAELNRLQYKVGLLVVVIAEPSHFVPTQTKLQEYIKNDKTGRLVFCILKKELAAQTLEDWLRAKTHVELANEDGLQGSKSKFEQEMGTILESWSSNATNEQLVAFYGSKTYRSIFGSGDLMRHIKQDVIFTMFPAAPEQVVLTNTAYRRAQESAALAGITRESKSAQIKSIETGVIGAKVWGCTSIELLETATGSVGAKTIAELAKFIHGKMTQGAKIRLDQLWLNLQKPPFGYYNNLACAYLLGFVFRFWKDSEFNWVNSDSNPFPLNDNNLATMINNMCQDKVPNNTLSSGSEIWQKFKPYLKSVFELQDNEVPNEERARHYLISKITYSGTPLWALKYVDTNETGGIENKAVYDSIIDNFSLFVLNRNEDNQEDIMAKVVSLFTGKGKIRQALNANFKNDALRYSAFKSFIIMSADSDLGLLIATLKLNDNDLFDAIKRLMQKAIETWEEEQVKAKLSTLTLEYGVIAELNKALGVSEKTLAKHIESLKNCFDLMKVPGTVIETLDAPWFHALAEMRNLTLTPWQNLTANQKQAIIDCFKEYARDAWQNLSSSKNLLAKYLDKKGVIYNEDDLVKVFGGINECPYATSVPVYESMIKPLIGDIKHEHSKTLLLTRWLEIGGTKTIKDWCRKYNVPIQWVASPEDLQYFDCVLNVNAGRLVSEKELNNAVHYLNGKNFAYLQDVNFIQNKFFEQIGEKNCEGFTNYRDDLLGRIRLECGADVHAWANQGAKIVGLIEGFLKAKFADKVKAVARDKVNTLQEAELRTRILTAFDSFPELYKFFVD
ncbi:Hypothetical protein DEACI_3937 [Acididesulfobacillus acetoxydans]|uniref:BREX system P-loop protein BrxC n=1 Tax=Acididesulfobacillus acetoxydans TaxID=1561005 RepID=A0A8S0WR72_9FIRM|nr:hypothetical protein [Acididesulfobacillus acetoxydans]CAA7603114.1 Hypothetical protein DEACI_3937 [Acididesulfobacillus acetoxydans]CEJ05648.1 Hypothetical protein DEACI_0022 [Acididesulfobacillus acetoxydans]